MQHLAVRGFTVLNGVGLSCEDSSNVHPTKTCNSCQTEQECCPGVALICGYSSKVHPTHLHWPTPVQFGAHRIQWTGTQKHQNIRTANALFDCGIGPCVWPEHEMGVQCRQEHNAFRLTTCIIVLLPREFQTHDGQAYYLYHRDVSVPAGAQQGQADYLYLCASTDGVPSTRWSGTLPVSS